MAETINLIDNGAIEAAFKNVTPEQIISGGGAAAVASEVAIPFGVDLLSKQPSAGVEGLPMGKPTETATSWEGVGDSHNDD